MAAGYFRDGTIGIELGAHAFATPSAFRRNIVLAERGRPAEVLDAGGGMFDLMVTGQRLRADLGDAERWAYEHFHALASSHQGRLGVEDNMGNRHVFGDAVCVGGRAQVHAFGFVDMRMEWRAPARSSQPAWESVPSAPATYPGTSNAQDYAAGGVAIGTPFGMRIEMMRSYPLREIPRARGARSRGPRRNAQIRFVVMAHLVDTSQTLAEALEDLARSIGPRAVDLTANGNTYADVLLESLRPGHTDLQHTGFEAEFVMQLDPYDAPTTTTTAGS